MITTEPVDAVITWVDGSDKAHAEKLAHYCTKHNIDRKSEAASTTRFNDRGELDYCVQSLLRFAPWLRTIYIVTDEQRPPVLDSIHKDKLRLIDHRDIFSGFEHYLPTFNSLTIETLLWRIEDLANHFIYLNDDFSLIRPVAKEDFFRQNKLVLRGQWKVQMAKKWRNLWKKSVDSFPQNAHRSVQEKSAVLAGLRKHFFHLPHAPYPVMKTTFTDYFTKHPELLLENIDYPLRDPKQFWPISLAQHLEIQNKNAIIDNRLDTITINGACHSLDKIKSRLNQADKKRNYSFFCMQSIDEAPEEVQKFVFAWLDARLL